MNGGKVSKQQSPKSKVHEVAQHLTRITIRHPRPEDTWILQIVGYQLPNRFTVNFTYHNIILTFYLTWNPLFINHIWSNHFIKF